MTKYKTKINYAPPAPKGQGFGVLAPVVKNRTITSNPTSYRPNANTPTTQQLLRKVNGMDDYDAGRYLDQEMRNLMNRQAAAFKNRMKDEHDTADAQSDREPLMPNDKQLTKIREALGNDYVFKRYVDN